MKWKNEGGKYEYKAISSIFKFNIDEEKWYNTTYKMSRPRYYHAISVVDFKYYSKFCEG